MWAGAVLLFLTYNQIGSAVIVGSSHVCVCSSAGIIGDKQYSGLIWHTWARLVTKARLMARHTHHHFPWLVNTHG